VPPALASHHACVAGNDCAPKLLVLAHAAIVERCVCPVQRMRAAPTSARPSFRQRTRPTSRRRSTGSRARQTGSRPTSSTSPRSRSNRRRPHRRWRRRPGDNRRQRRDRLLGRRARRDVGRTRRPRPSLHDRRKLTRIAFAALGGAAPEGCQYGCRGSCGGSVVLVDEAAEAVVAADRRSAGDLSPPFCRVAPSPDDQAAMAFACGASTGALTIRTTSLRKTPSNEPVGGVHSVRV
jgi:hypothetical protein